MTRKCRSGSRGRKTPTRFGKSNRVVTAITAIAITDASHCPKKHHGAYAVWIRIGDRDIKQAGPLPEGRVNGSLAAEYFAIVAAVEISNNNGVTHLTLWSDNRGSINLARKDKYLNDGIVVSFRFLKKENRGATHQWCDRESRRIMKLYRRIKFKKIEAAVNENETQPNF